MRKEKALAILFFLSLVAENDWVLAYYHHMWTPARLFEWLTDRLSIKISVFEIICLLLLVITPRRGQVATPLIRAIQISLASLLFSTLYGLATGGAAIAIYTQIIAWVVAMVFALTIIKVCTTAADIERMGTAIVCAAIWRSAVAVVFYVETRSWDWSIIPQYMTTHEDTVLFGAALGILVSRALEMRTKQDVRWLAIGAPLILLGIQVNNRRIAWATVACVLAVLYFMLPTRSVTLRKLNRTLAILAPFLLVYAIVGWGRPGKIFKPLQAFASMGGGQIDNSTRARDNENTSLVTMIADGPIIGTGLGHEWIELDSSQTIPTSVFPMYHYSPHDSIFALMAFYGSAGFAALWMVLPVSVYLNARTYRASKNPAERSAAAAGIVQVVAYVNQAFGDMGAMGPTHIVPSTIMAVGLASAARLSILSGAWPQLRRRVPQPAA